MGRGHRCRRPSRHHHEGRGPSERLRPAPGMAQRAATPARAPTPLSPAASRRTVARSPTCSNGSTIRPNRPPCSSLTAATSRAPPPTACSSTAPGSSTISRTRPVAPLIASGLKRPQHSGPPVAFAAPSSAAGRAILVRCPIAMCWVESLSRVASTSSPALSRRVLSHRFRGPREPDDLRGGHGRVP
jgi:hypothetical protein